MTQDRERGTATLNRTKAERWKRRYGGQRKVEKQMRRKRPRCDKAAKEKSNRGREETET